MTAAVVRSGFRGDSATLSRALLMLGLLVAGSPAAAQAQGPATGRTEEVVYVNEEDGTRLVARLALPATSAPAPGVVVLSIAGTDPLVGRLLEEGYAVLSPMRRGFVEVEPLLRATFDDLSGDVDSALRYLASRPDVDGTALAVIAQGDDTQPAMLAGFASASSVPLVLLAPPAYPGAELFRLEQRWLAGRAGARDSELEALDRYVADIAHIVLDGSAPYATAYRLQELRAGSPVELRSTASFPPDDRQAHFFASPLWHDRLAFEPAMALVRVRAPLLVLIGEDDPYGSADAWLTAMQGALSGSPSQDATICLIPGRTRHAFAAPTVETIMAWLGPRFAGGARAGAPSACSVVDGGEEVGGSDLGPAPRSGDLDARADAPIDSPARQFVPVRQ